jgi:molybdate transport system substrate-binding protein
VAPAGPVTLEAYIPCGMTAPFHDALEAFQAANAAVKVKTLYDNDALLLKLVRDQGKRPDVFVSPGGRELEVLRERGLVDSGLAVRVGSFKIVAVVRRDWPGKVARAQDLATDAVKSISLPDPDNSSMGWHVRQALTKLKLWDRVKAKIAPSDRIITAYQSLLNREADLTFTYRGCPLPRSEEELEKSRARIAFELPLDSYDEPQVAIGVLNTTAHRPQAEGLVHFLSSDPIVAMMVGGHGGNGLPDERGHVGTPPEVAEAGGATAEPSRPVGKAVLVAFFPNDADHRDVRAFLNSLPQRFPGKVTLEIHNFKDPNGDPEGFRKWQKAGLGCAGILLNGKNAFTLGTGKAQRLVRFQRKMDVQWRHEELLTAIQQEIGPANGGNSRGG